jgi:hypothetical protein
VEDDSSLLDLCGSFKKKIFRTINRFRLGVAHARFSSETKLHAGSEEFDFGGERNSLVRPSTFAL